MFLGRQLVSDKILDVLRLGRSCKLAVSDFLLENEDQPGIHRSNSCQDQDYGSKTLVQERAHFDIANDIAFYRLERYGAEDIFTLWC